MAISFSCECGKRLKVADNLLGKKVKCPDCQKVTVVTAEADSGLAKPVAAKPKPAPAPPKPASKRPAPMDDDEPDLSSLLDDMEEAPKPAKRKAGKPTLDEDLEPDLSSLLGDDDDEPVPTKKKSKTADQEADDFMSSLDDDEAPPARKSKKLALADDDDLGDAGQEGDEDEDEAPVRGKKKPEPPKKKKSKMLLILVVVLLLLLGGGGAGVYFLAPELIGMGPPLRPAPMNNPPKKVMPATMFENKDKDDGKKDDVKKDDSKKDLGKKDGGKDDTKKDDTKKDDAKKVDGKKDDKEDKKDPDKKVADAPDPKDKEFENTVGMKLLRIEPGKFTMGSPPDEKERESIEQAHAVEITQPFYLGKFEVTQAEFMGLMGTNPSKFKGDKLPVESVSWDEAKEFCTKLSDKDGRTYTLPTEAEWEYACRAGTKTPFSFGDTLSPEQADISGEKTADVGSFKPNAWGLFDMHGNVAEWCEDRFARDYYKATAKKDPKGPTFGDFRCVRGGSWSVGPAACRSAFRFNELASRNDETIGFRVVLRLSKTAAKEEPKKDDDEPKKEEPKKEKDEPKKDKEELKKEKGEPKKDEPKKDESSVLSKGIDAATVAAYEALGGMCGVMSTTRTESRNAAKNAEKGSPGFRFSEFPGSKMPDVNVPFGLLLDEATDVQLKELAHLKNLMALSTEYSPIIAESQYSA